MVLSTLFAQPPLEQGTVKNDRLFVVGREIPVDSSGYMRINFSSEPGKYQHLSYRSIVEGDFDPLLVEHKVVLIGMTATAESDFWITPISQQKMSGVEIHANAIDTILRQRFIRDENQLYTLLTCLLLVVLTAFALPRLGLRWGGVVIAGLFFGYLAGVFYAFDHGYILNILHPATILPLAYSTSLIYRAIDERRDRRRIESIFGRYVSPEVAQEIMKLDDERALLLGGERREATILFCDARGYTAMSEKAEPEEVLNIMNKYFSIIIPCLLANQGMVNKFAGDNIMAIWGAPSNQSDHALLSVKAGLDAQLAIGEVQTTHPDLPKIEFGIGINTGQVVAGNVGSTGRTEYTVIGDVVNIASRLCGMAPGGKIWLSQETYQQIEPYVEARELESQYVKGKQKPLKVYEAVALK
jgi:adenylate cyclase